MNVTTERHLGHKWYLKPMFWSLGMLESFTVSSVTLADRRHRVRSVLRWAPGRESCRLHCAYGWFFSWFHILCAETICRSCGSLNASVLQTPRNSTNVWAARAPSQLQVILDAACFHCKLILRVTILPWNHLLKERWCLWYTLFSGFWQLLSTNVHPR